MPFADVHWTVGVDEVGTEGAVNARRAPFGK